MNLRGHVVTIYLPHKFLFTIVYFQVFSASQIIGGLLLGYLTDAKFLRKKTVLFLSFGGSAIAYLMIAYGGFTALILSRILVGLVKQTMTVTTSMLTVCTAPEIRSRNMGRLQSSSTAAWILGPSAGALLFKCMCISYRMICFVYL